MPVHATVAPSGIAPVDTGIVRAVPGTLIPGAGACPVLRVAKQPPADQRAYASVVPIPMARVLADSSV